MPKILPALVAFVALALAPFVSAQSAGRTVYDFNADWRLTTSDPAAAQEQNFDDSSWKAISLPHAWNEDDAFRVAIDQHSTGIAWYRKTFRLPAGSAGKKVFLEFEGIRQAGEFWLNGKYLGTHENGVMAFGFDISDLVRDGAKDNVLAVRIDNAWGYREKISNRNFQWADRNFNANYGGIPKNVKLHVTDRVYQTLPLYSHLGSTGVYLYATDFDIAGRRATIHAESEIRNESTAPRKFKYEVTLKDRDGREVARFDGGEYTLAPRDSVVATARREVTGLNFWSWGYGYLYTVETALIENGTAFDVVRTTTGFRKTEFAHGMVKLNDRAIHIRGYAQRTSNEWPALGLSVPPWLSDYSNQLMVESGGNMVRWMHVTPWKQDVESCDRVGLMQMMPAGDSERDAQGWQWAQRVALMRDAIIYNRNNPSIVVYESGNNGISERHMAEMKAVRDFYDPHGGRAIGSRDMLESHATEYGGEMLYINKSARQPFWQTEYSRDEGHRKYWDNFSPPFHQDGDGPLYRNAPAPTYNRNQDSHAVETVVRWFDYWRERPGTGTRVNGGGLNIVFSDSNTHFRGAENYRRSGEVDAMRIPKDSFFAHRVMWNGWVDPRPDRIHIVGHWNYAPGVVKPVHVISAAERVEIFLNGQSLGFGKQSSRFLFTFEKIAWAPGKLTAIGYDANGTKISETSHETTGAAVALKLTPIGEPAAWRADGADVVLVQVEAVDAQGRRNPIALNPVDFELTGPAEWRGGLAQGRDDNFILARSLPVEGGVNRVLIRSTRTAGTVKLVAKSVGLQSAELQFTSKPVEVEHGLSTEFAASRLTGNLSLGPTPSTETVTVTRRAISIAHAESSTGGKIEEAYDDDETTAWIGRGPITFHFSQSVEPSEIVVKTLGFRARVYPVRIRVGETEVFRGVIKRSLGYVTLPLKPTRGKALTIELLEGGEAKDAFAGMQELEDQKNATTGEERVSSGSLGLAEIEIYERSR